jgi:hypothetical protein
MQKILEPQSPMSRCFVDAPPKGWIKKETLLEETNISDRMLAEWAPQLGLRICLVSRGRKGIDSYYQPSGVPTINRLRELGATGPRDMNERLWRLWLEGHDVDIPGWAKKHLTSGLKELGRRHSSGNRLIRNRVRAPMHRTELDNYAPLAAAGRAGLAQEASIHYADPPIWELILKVGGLPSNAKPPADELKNVEQKYSFSYLVRVLDTATDKEIEQARRDLQTVAGWVDAARMIDWNVVSPELNPKIESLTGAPPEPPSWRARKARRQRPLPPPAVIQSLIAFWSEFAARAAVLPLVIDYRRSPKLDQMITTAAAMLQLEMDRLPRRLAP